MKTITDKKAQSTLHTLLSGYDQLNMKIGDQASFKQLMHNEPALVSSFSNETNDEQIHETLVLFYGDHLVGGISFYVSKNHIKKVDRNLYGRIDIVIVPKKYRANNISNTLVLLSIMYMNLAFENRLYSMSSLAAHEAISKVLEGLKFNGIKNEKENFTRQNISLDSIDHQEYFKFIEMRLASTLHQTNYKLHKVIGSVS